MKSLGVEESWSLPVRKIKSWEVHFSTCCPLYGCTTITAFFPPVIKHGNRNSTINGHLNHNENDLWLWLEDFPASHVWSPEGNGNLGTFSSCHLPSHVSPGAVQVLKLRIRMPRQTWHASEASQSLGVLPISLGISMFIWPGWEISKYHELPIIKRKWNIVKLQAEMLRGKKLSHQSPIVSVR